MTKTPTSPQNKLIVSILESIASTDAAKINASPQTYGQALKLAKENKIAFLYLESLSKNGTLTDTSELKKFKDLQQKNLALVTYLAKSFDHDQLNYVIIKTLKPFKYVGSDIDVLFKSPKDFSKALTLLLSDGFVLLDNDMFTATVCNDALSVVDLQLELTVAGLPYLNKKYLFENVKASTINDYPVKTLEDWAEIVVIAAHSLYKEHMYTLADYYTIALSLKEDNVKTLCLLAKKSKAETAVVSLLTWVASMHVFAGCPLSLVYAALADLKGTKAYFRTTNRQLSLPFTFPMLTVLASLLHKITTDNRTRSSLLRALAHDFSSKYILAVIEHFRRTTY